MGYADVHGSYHKGPKKNKRARKNNIPRFEEAKPTKPLSAADEAVIGLLGQMDAPSMTAFVKATAYPNPMDVVIVTPCGGRPRPIVLDETDARQTHSGRVYIGGVVGVGVGVPSQPKPQPKPTVTVNVPKDEGEIVGYIIRKTNGELVLKMK